ncbi:uncharacterized protein MELLADRAFT_69891 [Melampsora larici-populina 98AG31]|uniref:Uncharacterized protein n=1 Tax=Melampsora larici-populina (strain 98AG31 / pathotype 3-4-7) TaxID=747676 RepID=F4SCN6_MELLP|nr:uncharacterized protein MELLADRAFT_69891 [Melampsora larici-populina 98AG31]EGF97594.1 hypothetical protein MELLADRAFT_69891 [Melampsora larici-populina 98AG31]
MAPRSTSNRLLPKNRLEKPKQKSSKSLKELSEMDKAEEEWCHNECDQLSRVLSQPRDTVTSTSTSVVNDFFFIEGNPGDYNSEDDNMNQVSSPEIDSGTESEDSEQSIASLSGVGCVVTAAVGDYNRKRRIREERQWQDVIEPMFRCFMRCKLLTFDWSQPETWNIDLKDPCRCPASKKRVRELDLIDILYKNCLHYAAVNREVMLRIALLQAYQVISCSWKKR